MKKTAYGTPLFLDDGNITVLYQKEARDEAAIQELVFHCPSCLPISDIDESYNPVVSVCTELNTPVGPLDVLMITPSGRLVIVETKLWRNPEARRSVVGQILDYATEMSKWSYADLQREVNRRLGLSGNSLYEIAKKAGPDLVPSEPDFVDGVSRYLSRGQFLLLVVGDGIRSGASRIADFLANAGHLNFTFAMVELALYKGINEGTMVMPRTIVKTVELPKITVEVPAGLMIRNEVGKDKKSPVSVEWEQEKLFYRAFWEEFIEELHFDDPEQTMPVPSNCQNLYVYPGSTCYAWVSAYFAMSKKQIGVYFRCRKEEPGRQIYDQLSENRDQIREALGDKISWNWDFDNQDISISTRCEDVFDEEKRDDIKDFFNQWVNTFVNVFRPRMREL